MPLKRDMNRSSPHGGNVDAGKNVLAAVASEDTSSGGRREEEQVAFALLQGGPSGCQASSSRGSGKKSGNKRSPRLISLGSIEDDLESDGEMNK